MEAWEPLTPEQEERALHLWRTRFGDYAGLVTPLGATKPVPSIIYSIEQAYGQPFDHFERDTNAKTLAAFRQCTTQEQALYAIDVHHTLWHFWPHRIFDSDNPRAWEVPVLPDGDYFIFFAEDCSFGIFGHPWEKTLCVFGQPLLDAFALDMPLLFTEIVRENR